LWATQRLLPLTREGEFAAGLSQGREAAVQLYQRIQGDARFITGFAPELDILVWAVRAPSIAAASAYAHEIFERAAHRDLHLALVQLPARLFSCWPESAKQDGAETPEPLVTCLRSVLMKPEHLAWSDQIWSRLSAATDEVVNGANLPKQAGES
jgi:tyrosine decarboxylase / aspartate 1-decarboxylase